MRTKGTSRAMTHLSSKGWRKVLLNDRLHKRLAYIADTAKSKAQAETAIWREMNQFIHDTGGILIK